MDWGFVEPRKGELFFITLSLFRCEGLGLWRERVRALAYDILGRKLI
jgi:hypothetical protein